MTILNDVSEYPAPRAQLARVLGEAYARRGRSTATANLLLVDDKAIAKLNRDHAGKNGPTDVLAFPDGEADPQTRITHLGDIALSVTTARREARARRLRVRDELTLYALHGLLHLLGMRDDTERGRAAMAATQEDEFRRQGLPTAE